MGPSEPYFPDSYLASRQWFRDQLSRVRQHWPASDLGSHALTDYPSLSLDWIEAPASSTEEQMLVLSTAVHGTEGLTGTAVLHRFLESYLQRLDPAETGLLLLHAINPWGMQHRRRTNANNVDLNRNFRFAGNGQRAFENPTYHHLRTLIHPSQELGDLRLETLRLLLRLVRKIVQWGIAPIRQATLLGQLEDPQGMYFGGGEPQEESLVAWELLTNKIKAYRKVIHIDVHTGYGPRNQMTLVNSVKEQCPPGEWVERFNYPHIVRADPEAFYSMQGDMLDALYEWAQQHAPQHEFFGTAFEFGTMGAGLLAQVRGLRAMVFENQITHHGAASEAIARQVRREFGELFNPASIAWRRAAMRAADQAFTGIFREFGLLQKE